MVVHTCIVHDTAPGRYHTAMIPPSPRITVGRSIYPESREGYCHDWFLPVGHGLKGRLRVKVAASRRGYCGCAAMRCRGEQTWECSTRGKVPHRVHEVFSAGFGLEASKLSFMQKRWSRSKALDAVVRPLHEPSLVRL